MKTDEKHIERAAEACREHGRCCGKHAGGISRMWSRCSPVNPSMANSLVPLVGGNLMTFRQGGNSSDRTVTY